MTTPGSGPVVFVSPHLDDVVWSCPVHVLRTVAAGRPAIVATVFSRSDGAEQQATRTAEDTVAVELLGAEPRHLGHADAPWRPRWWAGRELTFADLVCEPVPAHLCRNVAWSISQLVAVVGATTVVAPLGVGHHLDHRTVFAAVDQLCLAGGLGGRGDVEVCYYEDRPYSFVEHSAEVRLAELGVAVASDRGGIDWSRHWASFESAPYVREFLVDPADRRRIVGCVQAGAGIAGRRRSRGRDKDRRATAVGLVPDRAEAQRARRAISAYASQVPMFLTVEVLTQMAESERRWTICGPNS